MTQSQFKKDWKDKAKQPFDFPDRSKRDILLNILCAIIGITIATWLSWQIGGFIINLFV